MIRYRWTFRACRRALVGEVAMSAEYIITAGGRRWCPTSAAPMLFEMIRLISSFQPGGDAEQLRERAKFTLNQQSAILALGIYLYSDS